MTIKAKKNETITQNDTVVKSMHSIRGVTAADSSVIPAQSEAVLEGMQKAIVCQEDETEEGNFCRARRLQIRSDQYYSFVSHQKKQTGAMVSTNSRAAIEPTASLSEVSFEVLMQDENESLLKPLVKYKGCFSKSELDLGLAYKKNT